MYIIHLDQIRIRLAAQTRPDLAEKFAMCRYGVGDDARGRVPHVEDVADALRYGPGTLVHAVVWRGAVRAEFGELVGLEIGW